MESPHESDSDDTDTDDIQFIGEEDHDIHTTLRLEDALISDDNEEEDGDEDLPPILAPPSTGYLHAVNENQPPPELRPVEEEEEEMEIKMEVEVEETGQEKAFEVVDLLDSDEGSSTTDSDDELVNVDYVNDPPDEFVKLLKKYKFLAKKDQFVYNLKNMYKKQPSRIKRLLKMHKDAEGNPVEEPVKMLFEKIHAEREIMKQAQNLKHEKEDDVEESVPTVVQLTVPNTATKLTHVMFPGNVVNNDKAVEMLGGIGAVSKIFEQPNKKLTMKFRPNDPFANGSTAQGRSSSGLLLRVRYRKGRRIGEEGQNQEAKSAKESEKINLDTLGAEPMSSELIQDMLLDNQLHVKNRDRRHDRFVTINDKKYKKEDLLKEDKRISDQQLKERMTKKAWEPKQTKEYNVKLPKIPESTLDPNIQVETLGIVHRSYEFNGICDFQYLPVTKNPDGTLVSIKDRIFPILGSADNAEKLVMMDLVNELTPSQTFSLPPAMSRIDNPPRGLIEELIVSEKSEGMAKRLPPDDSIFSNRMKRIIYTISYNFQADANAPENSQEVPSQPLTLALKDIERRQIKKDMIESVRIKFEERPIWSKSALEYATKITSQTLKYIIPSFAYFAANGPWRNTWIKFGVDPRKKPIYVIYQSVDFRIPFIYRRFMNVGPKSVEANHRYLPDHIPPKTQMFYQLCDIKLDQIKALIQTLEKLLSTDGLTYDERFGFLKEGSYEYFRYIMNHYLENVLHEHGKIPAAFESSIESIQILPGEIEPREKVKAAPHRRVKTKRIRRTAKRVLNPGQSKGKAKKKDPSNFPSSCQKALEDLSLSTMQLHSGSEDVQDFDDDDDDDDGDEIYFEDA